MVAEEGLPWSAGCCGASRTIVSIRSRCHISRRGDFLTPAGLLALRVNAGAGASGRRRPGLVCTVQLLRARKGNAADGGSRAAQSAVRELVPQHLPPERCAGQVTDAAAGAPSPLSCGRVGELQVQGGQVRQDPVLADVGVLRPTRIRFHGGCVAVAAPVSRLAVGPGGFHPPPAATAYKQPGRDAPEGRPARRLPLGWLLGQGAGGWFGARLGVMASLAGRQVRGGVSCGPAAGGATIWARPAGRPGTGRRSAGPAWAVHIRRRTR